MKSRTPLRTLRTAEDLAAAGLIGNASVPAITAVAERYDVAVPPAMTALIDRDDVDDPIARQFVPDPRELTTLAEERIDPIGDDVHAAVPGIVHRYPDRVLLKPTHVCPVYCRFCFRREMVGRGGGRELSSAALAVALNYVREHAEIAEVIVTGGDPLVLGARRVGEISRGLAAIPHVSVVRWHTRVPIVTPELVTDEQIAALKAGGKAVWIGVHVNHPRELTEAARSALARLVHAGLPLLAQTVLLKGVNDNAETLAALFRDLIALRVKPYYLHHADLAPGTSHFRTTVAEGQAIMRSLRGRISGLALPTYILDVPGGFGKVPIGPDYLAETDGVRHVRDVSGDRHVHPDLTDR